MMNEVKNRQWPCGCIDLETLSTSAEAVVLEIGAVLFDPATLELGPEYHAEVEMRAADNRLRAIDSETWLWWGERMKEGADIPGMHGGVSLWQGLQGLTEFFKGQELTEGFEMWAWGRDFDFGILRHAHDDAQLALPWRYSRQCDARSFCGQLGIKREGPVMHQALADARQEAQAVMGAMFKLAALRTSDIEHRTSNIEGGEEDSASSLSTLNPQPSTSSDS